MTRNTCAPLNARVRILKPDAASAQRRRGTAHRARRRRRTSWRKHVQAHYQIDPALSPRADYALNWRGRFMRDAGILDGDMLAVHKTAEVRSGQIVVARLRNEVTVKRLRRRGATVELLPENPEFESIVIDTREGDFAIEGLGVGVIRGGGPL